MAISKGGGANPKQVIFKDSNGIIHDCNEVWYRKSISDEYFKVWPESPDSFFIQTDPIEGAIYSPNYPEYVRKPILYDGTSYKIDISAEIGYKLDTIRLTIYRADGSIKSDLNYTELPPIDGLVGGANSKYEIVANMIYLGSTYLRTINGDNCVINPGVESAPTEISIGTKTTFTCTPNRGYRFKEWSCKKTDRNGNVTNKTYLSNPFVFDSGIEGYRYDWVAVCEPSSTTGTNYYIDVITVPASYYGSNYEITNPKYYDLIGDITDEYIAQYPNSKSMRYRAKNIKYIDYHYDLYQRSPGGGSPPFSAYIQCFNTWSDGSAIDRDNAISIYFPSTSSRSSEIQTAALVYKKPTGNLVITGKPVYVDGVKRRSGTYNNCTIPMTLTVPAISGYTFKYWKFKEGNGAYKTSTAPVLNNSYAGTFYVEAVYEEGGSGEGPAYVTVRSSDSAMGYVLPELSIQPYTMSSKQYTVNAYSTNNYVFDHWSYNTPSGGPYTDNRATMPVVFDKAGNYEYVAYYRLRQFPETTINLNVTAPGSGSVYLGTYSISLRYTGTDNQLHTISNTNASIKVKNNTDVYLICDVQGANYGWYYQKWGNTINDKIDITSDVSTKHDDKHTSSQLIFTAKGYTVDIDISLTGMTWPATGLTLTRTVS